MNDLFPNCKKCFTSYRGVNQVQKRAPYVHHDICRRSNQADKPRDKQRSWFVWNYLFENNTNTKNSEFKKFKTSKTPHIRFLQNSQFATSNIIHKDTNSSTKISPKRENNHAMRRRAKTSFQSHGWKDILHNYQDQTFKVKNTVIQTLTHETQHSIHTKSNLEKSIQLTKMTKYLMKIHTKLNKNPWTRFMQWVEQKRQSHNQY